MRRSGGAALAFIIFVAAGGRAGAEETDFIPEFGVLEGADLTHDVLRNFDAYELPVGEFTRDEQPVETLEGRVREQVYRIEGEVSTLEVVRNYERRLSGLGYETRFECAGDACGGFDFRFGVFLVEPPAMRFNLADFRFLAMSDEERNIHAAVLASRQGGDLYVQIVTVAGEAAPESLESAEDAPQPQAKSGEARLYALARRLTETGHAALDGVDFEAGSARLTDASAPVLAQAAALLRERPDLNFIVVGHTDNQGGLDLNLGLSRERAEAVADRIAEEEGVSRARLAARGVAFLAPRASNATAAGRAANRRVELVVE